MTRAWKSFDRLYFLFYFNGSFIFDLKLLHCPQPSVNLFQRPPIHLIKATYIYLASLNILR
uniref:Uncharacterized protein n=1 Tax=Daphnia magna TaxID=35525 RepID=A0A0P6I3X6_9CRUS